MTFKVATLVGVAFIALPLLLTVKHWVKAIIPLTKAIASIPVVLFFCIPAFWLRTALVYPGLVKTFVCLVSITTGILVITTGFEMTYPTLTDDQTKFGHQTKFGQHCHYIRFFIAPLVSMFLVIVFSQSTDGDGVRETEAKKKIDFWWGFPKCLEQSS